MLFRKKRDTKEEEYRRVELEPKDAEALPSGPVHVEPMKETSEIGQTEPVHDEPVKETSEIGQTEPAREEPVKETAGTTQTGQNHEEAVKETAEPDQTAPVREKSINATTHDEKKPEKPNEIFPEESAEEEEGENAGQEKKGFVLLKRILLTVLIIAASVLMTFAYSLWKEYSADESHEGKEIVVEIPKGASTVKVASILQDSGVIRYETPFLLKMRSSEYRGKLRYGTFTLNDGMCLDDIIGRLMTGGDTKDKSTLLIPEGYSVEMIAAKLERQDIMPAEEFLEAVTKAAETSDYAGQLPDKDKVFYQLQGYLFPDTYHITEDMTADELVEMMLDEFSKKFDSGRLGQAKKAGMTVEEVLIRASLVQKETEVAEEYAMIAGVINNRLAQNMKIQFDSTVIYPMSQGLFGVSHLTYDDLKIQSPYSTYYVKGLPVGPICNPGLEAIDGVLNPKKHNYLYFQTDQVKNDGTSLFFETYEEHAAAQATTEREIQTQKGDAEDTTATTSSEKKENSDNSQPATVVDGE